ncbi:hypothetical protein DQM20_14100 [Lactiplantibacillus plantarum]|uniref:hypothetical protein n=1 Tax=Lactiplantibacillus plantarum TaxID=1590 RepID=UPI000E099585|nr:hypothetical protein [Lactiplantibacillus plantarum]RDG24600.1 hypothetical protein DQM20_14100 [Lactiplantibacillus plantarum]
MNNTLKEQLKTVIDKYGLTYKNYDEEEDLAPSNVEYDLINDILDTFSDAVYEFIKGDGDDD